MRGPQSGRSQARSWFGRGIIRAAVMTAVGCAGLGAVGVRAEPPAVWIEPSVEVLPPIPLTATAREDHEDQLTAAAWAARGRIHQLRNEPRPALRAYQRAYFWDPTARTLLPDIALLALDVHRDDVAQRYALLAIHEGAARSPGQRRQLASLLGDGGEFERAAQLYRESVNATASGQYQWDDYVALFESARLSYLNNRPDIAAKSLERVLEWVSAAPQPTEPRELAAVRRALVEDSDQPLELMLDVFVANKQPELAQRVLDLQRRHHGQTPMRDYRQAEVDWLANRPEPARRALDEYRRQHANVAGMAPYGLLARMVDGDVPAATPPSDKLLAELERWRLDDPGNVPLALFHAERLGRAGRSEQARNVYRQLLARDGIQEAYVGLLQQLTREGSAGAILDLLIEYVSLNGTLEFLNPAYSELTSDGELVRRVLAEAQRRVDGRDESPYVPLVALALGSSTPDDAVIANWLQVVDAQPTPITSDMLLRIGLDLIVAGRAAVADTVLSAGLRRAAPDQRAQFHYYRCEALEQQDQLAEALEMIRLAVEEATPDVAATVRTRCGWLLVRAGETAEGESMLRAVVDEYGGDLPGPDEPPVEEDEASADEDENEDEDGDGDGEAEAGEVSEADAEQAEVVMQARMVLSSMYAGQNRVKEAETQLVEVLLDEPRHVGAMNDLAYLWVDSGRRLARSLRMLLEVVKQEPDNAAYRDSLGWCYYQLGRYGQALEQLRQAAAGSEPDGVILDHLGDTLQKLGDAAGAKDAWQRSLERLSEPDLADVRAAVAAKLEGLARPPD